ncbi:MAG: hypothetical protein ABSF90_02545 [Syntrophobacteraceae bacterium]|jgi:hypothetical protein
MATTEVLGGTLKKSAPQLGHQIDELVRLLRRGYRGRALRKSAQGLDASCQQLLASYKVARKAELEKLDALDRRLAEKGGFTLDALNKMTVHQKTTELLKRVAKEE